MRPGTLFLICFILAVLCSCTDPSIVPKYKEGDKVRFVINGSKGQVTDVWKMRPIANYTVRSLNWYGQVQTITFVKEYEIEPDN